MSDDANVSPPAKNAGVPSAAEELAASDPAPTPQTERIAGPLLCVKCNYDLAGLTREQKCPECGTPAAETLASIAAAPVAEHLKLHRGLLLIAIAMIGGVVWLATGQLALASIAFAMVGAGLPDWVMFVLGAVIPSLSAAWVLVSALGWSRITRAAGRMLPERARMARAVGRCAWLYAFAFLVVAVSIAVVSILDYGPGSAEHLLTALVGLTLAIWVVRTALGFGLLASIASSCRARRTRGTMRALVWVAIALPVIIIGLSIGAAFLSLQTVAGIWVEYLIMGSTLGLGGAIIALGVCALVLRRMLAPFARGRAR